ncbi:hypothetical protein EDD22DRAFT_1004774 [Suillus occidentalis]|nr:hypothetical protein EDD22DRAFT_1004774 [Suillus occidentalis]
MHAHTTWYPSTIAAPQASHPITPPQPPPPPPLSAIHEMIKTAPTMSSPRNPPAPPSRRSFMFPPRAPSATGNPPPPKARGTLLSSLTSSMSSKPSPAEASAPSRSSGSDDRQWRDEPFDLSFPPMHGVHPSLTLKAAVVQACGRLDSNYHFVVPELSEETDFKLLYNKVLAEYKGFSACTDSYEAMNAQGNDEDLDQAIGLHMEALALRPVGHTDRSTLLSNLALRLSTCFVHRGKDEDLDQAILLDREALALCPMTRLSICFDHRGNNEFLEEAIALHREALALCPVGHRDRPSSLSGLANCFNKRCNDGDLDEAIETTILRTGSIIQCGLEASTGANGSGVARNASTLPQRPQQRDAHLATQHLELTVRTFRTRLPWALRTFSIPTLNNSLIYKGTGDVGSSPRRSRRARRACTRVFDG